MPLSFYPLHGSTLNPFLVLTVINRFHGAYSTVLEAEPLHNVFGELDVVATTLPEMADRIIAATQ